MSFRIKVRRLLACSVVAATGLLSMAGSHALVISAGTPITALPAYTQATLAPGQYVVPIEVFDAVNLQEWQFDLRFDTMVVKLVDVGIFYPGVLPAEFSAAQPEQSFIVNSGLQLQDGLLEGVGGFSNGISGDGLLAFIGFEFLVPGQDPGFEVGGVQPFPVPEPGTLVLVSMALAFLGQRRYPSPIPMKEQS